MNIRHRQQELRETLAEFYAELDRKWEEAEDFLLTLQVPAAITVPIKSLTPTEVERPYVSASHHHLGYVRHFGKWALCYGVTTESDHPDTFWMAIRSCSAEQKVEACRVFPQLLEQVLEAAESYSETVLEAVGLLDFSLGGKTPEAPIEGIEQKPEPNSDSDFGATESVSSEVANTDSKADDDTIEEPTPGEATASAPSDGIDDHQETVPDHQESNPDDEPLSDRDAA